MPTTGPLFPVSFSKGQASELVQKLLRRKNWRKFETKSLRLVLSPFYFFYYDAALEETREGRVIVKETKRGRAALDAATGELNAQVMESVESIVEPVNTLPEGIEAETKKPLFSGNEAEKIASLKTAGLLQVGWEDVVLSDFKMVYYPIWIATVGVGGEEHTLRISGVSGELLEEEKLPTRQKSVSEITKETLQELREPKAWLHYSKEVGATTAKHLGGGKKAESSGEAQAAGGEKETGSMHLPSFISKRDAVLAIMLLALLVIIVIALR
ncbi:MAG: hypothetical protein NTW59_03575 [Candidatus Diapherotrites archaeon]|nr:hypothetical protein [Candidatus Diapherotrites archaeon]